MLPIFRTYLSILRFTRFFTTNQAAVALEIDMARGALLVSRVVMDKLTINDLKVKDQRVLVRVDYNVPMEEKDGRMIINDATRIKETLPTLRLLVDKGAKIILAAHLGRPKGKREA